MIVRAPVLLKDLANDAFNFSSGDVVEGFQFFEFTFLVCKDFFGIVEGNTSFLARRGIAPDISLIARHLMNLQLLANYFQFSEIHISMNTPDK